MNRKEYEMLFQLNAQLGGGFNSAFSNAHKQIASMQKEIQALTKTQSDISAFQKQQSAVEATCQKLETLQQQYDNIQKEIKETEGYSSSLENKLLSKQQQIDKTSASLQQQTDKLNQMDNALRSAGVDTSNLAKESATLSAKMDDLKNKQEAVAESASEFGERTTASFSAIQSAITAAGITVALKEIGEAYKECIDIAADFEETMSTVEALSGASDSEINKLNSLAKDLGATTKFTAVEAAEAMTYMGMAGWKTNEMLTGMDGVLQLAAASGEDLATTSDIVTDNLTAFGMKASDTAHFSDVLAAAATNSNTSVSVMGETFKNSAALAGALKYSIEDVGVAVGLMANAGIKGSNAGTALKNIFNGLLGGVELTSKAFGEVKYSAINADGTMKSFGETMNDLRGYFSQMTGAEKLQNAETIAGQRAMAGFVSIMNSTEADFNSLTEKINNCSGAAAKMAEIKMDNLKGDITLMNSATEALKTTIGEQFNPELRKLYSTGTDIIGGMNASIKEHPNLMKSATAFVGVLGTATTAMTAYATISKVVKALDMASLFTSPVMLAIAGAATLTAGIVGIVGAYNDAQIAARRYGDAVTVAADEYREAMTASDELERNINEWRSLNETISSGAASADEVTAAKERLKETEQWLIDNYGVYLDGDGTISEGKIKSLEERNELLRETARLKAEIALHDAKKAFDEAEKEDIPKIKAKRDGLQEQNRELIEQQKILQEVANEWGRYTLTDEYQDYAKNGPGAESGTAVYEKMAEFNERLKSTVGAGATGDVRSVEADLSSLSAVISGNSDKVSEYNQELLEYNESLTALQKAGKEFVDFNISNIPTDSLQSFAEVARNIGEQAANAELDASEFASYAEQLTEVAHAAELLPEEQRIVFNADGALNVIEELADGVSELDGRTAEIIADANADAAYMKINNVQYKVLQYDDTTGVATLSADGTNATMQINRITGEVHMFDEEAAEAYISANIDDLESNVSSAKSLLATIHDKTITIKSVFQTVKDGAKNMLGLGNGYATGTDYATPGAHWVGENGPELLWFNGGEKVLNARDSVALVNDYSKMAQIQKILNASNNDNQDVFSAVEGISSFSDVHMSAFQPQLSSSAYQEPVSAMQSSEKPEYKIEIKNEFIIEGNASEETIAALENWGEKFREIVRDEFADILENNHRSTYI